MATPDESDIRSRQKAGKELTEIERLRDFSPFKDYFLRRVREKIEKRKAKILSTNTSADVTHQEKLIVEALERDVLRLLDEDEASCRSVIGETAS